MPRSTYVRPKRNQQILFFILSVMMVVSMGISLVATVTPTPPEPTPTPFPSATPPVVELTSTATPQMPLTVTPATQ